MYPPKLGVEYGACAAEAIELRKLAVESGTSIPMALHSEDFGFPLPMVGDSWLNYVVGDMAWHAPDLVDPLVFRGEGAPKGFSHREHVSWALQQPHPWQGSLSLDCPDLDLALEFEIKSRPEEIDEFRFGLLEHWTSVANSLVEKQKSWSTKAGGAIRKLVQRINGPLIALLVEAIGYNDPWLVDHCQKGFPFVDHLPPCAEASAGGLKLEYKVDSSFLRSNRGLLNEAVLSKLRESDFSGDVMEETLKDVEFGCMARVTKIGEVDLGKVSVSRRIAVRELRSKGWRTRVVDHMTESWQNPAMRPVDKVTHDCVDVLVYMLVAFLKAGVTPLMWKRDVSKAFRRLPVQCAHLDLCWVAFLHQGICYAAQHVGMPFGATSSVYAWHRVGAFLLAVVQRLFKAPAARYVDDYFGASRKGVKCTAGVCLEVVANLCGFPIDPAKSDNGTLELLILGAEVAVLLAEQAVSIKVDAKKAVKWSELLLSALSENRLDGGEASKMAGRLSFSVSVATNKVGRAFIKPLYAQAHATLPGGKMSLWLRAACSWWRKFLELRPPSLFNVGGLRTHTRIWTDAAGASRWIAAVMCFESKFFWTRMLVPPCVWDCFLVRQDNQIGMQELLAVPLALETFKFWLKGTLATIYIDNNGVLGGLIRGSCAAIDLNQAIGQLWLDIAELQVGLHAVRVESKANIADGPTREFLELLSELGATFVEPQLPAWCSDIWTFPA